jgi:hypothetical protein
MRGPSHNRLTAVVVTLISDTGSGRRGRPWWRGSGGGRRIARGLNGWLHRFRVDGESAVEVMGAVLGTVSSRTGRGLGAVATGSVAAADRPPAGQTWPVGAGVCVAERWRATAPSPACGQVADRGRAGGNHPRRCRWRLLPGDRLSAGAGALNGVPRVGPQRRPPPVSSPARRRRRLPASRSTQAGEAGHRAAAARGGGSQAEVALVTRADRRLVAGDLSR